MGRRPPPPGVCLHLQYSLLLYIFYNHQTEGIRKTQHNPYLMIGDISYTLLLSTGTTIKPDQHNAQCTQRSCGNIEYRGGRGQYDDSQREAKCISKTRQDPHFKMRHVRGLKITNTQAAFGLCSLVFFLVRSVDPAMV